MNTNQLVPKNTKQKLRDLRQQIDQMSVSSEKPLPYSEKKERVERCAVDPQFFFTTYLWKYFFNDPAPYHKELPVLFSTNNYNVPLVILAPRGGAKSTFLFGETLRLLITGQQKFIIRVEESERIANKEIFKIRNEIETNTQIYEDFGNMKSQPWTASELYFSNGCMLWGRGRRQPVRGTTHKQWRPTGIIYNDVESSKQVMNQSLTDEIYNALFTEAIPALNPRSAGGGFLAVVGTLLGEDSMLAQLIDPERSPLTRKIDYKALIGEDSVIELLLDKVSQDVGKISEFTTGRNTNDKKVSEAGRRFFRTRPDYMELLSKVRSYWPAQYPVEDLLLSAATIGTPQFKQEFLHIPINSSSSGPFVRKWFYRRSNTFDIGDIPKRNLMRAIFLDPSYRDSPTSDEKAFITGFYDLDIGVGYVVDVTAGTMSFDDMVKTAFQLAKEFLIGDVMVQGVRFPNEAFVSSIFGYENNGAQQWLESVFQDNASKYGFYLPKITGVTHTGNKIARISQLSYYIERARIRLDVSDDEHKKVVNQLCSLSNRKVYDDRADALEGWWSLVEGVKADIIMASKDIGFSRAVGVDQGMSFRTPLYQQGSRERYVPYSGSIRRATR